MAIEPKAMIPGEICVAAGDIEINQHRDTVKICVINMGDRPIQIGSHYHFYEANNALDFTRETTLGYRLNIAAGTAVRFEPGQKRTVELVAYAGTRQIFGFQGKIMGDVACLKDE
ncbi:urease subunit beta [Photobacterium phosphoreum]|uniref:urease subunit beta n=1 Tax=Photobacterium phosphoreum TaxID=659 RepID=UPI0019612D79|nr:urease subunit beta [Photobacterium phosphoreum]